MGKYNIKKLNMIILLIISLAYSCVQSPGSSRTKKLSATSDVSDTTTPEFPNSINFVENSGTKYQGTFDIPSNFNDFFNVKGTELHDYILQGTDFGNATHCLVYTFPFSNLHKYLVLAAQPRSNVSQLLGTREYFYSIKPSDSNANQSFCQSAAFIAALTADNPTFTVSYSPTDICPTCSTSLLRSTSLYLFKQSGEKITAVSLNNLSLKISPQSTNSNVNFTCNNTSQCKALSTKYDCCSTQGSCIQEGSPLPSTDLNSAQFLQSVEDIAQNSSNIKNYPHLYYTCASDPTTDIGDESSPTSGTTLSAEELAQKKLQEREDLYNCTTKVEGEMSICTVSFENVQQNSATTTFETLGDDLNFNTTKTSTQSIPTHSIFEVVYGGRTLYRDNALQVVGSMSIGTGNDNLTDKNSVTISMDKPSTAKEDLLYIRYKIDGSCEEVTSAKARCSKYYIQGQNDGKITDHFPGGTQFKVPLYADLTSSITVEVDGIKKINGTHYTVVSGSPGYIDFTIATDDIYDGQEVKINYLVNTAVNNAYNSIKIARDRIRSMCSAISGTNYPLGTYLAPKKDDSGNTIDFECKPPSTITTPIPFSAKFMLDPKTVPVRYFDISGKSYSTIDSSTPTQEGTEFSYTNQFKPNNVNNYIGFNEIYGSLSTLPNGARPAYELGVEKGKTYDIFVDKEAAAPGILNSSANAGNDYHNILSRIYPSLRFGSGLNPILDTADRTKSIVRADEFSFGRACFVPATMLAWSHRPQTDRQQQRLSRMAAQHFYYANGYNRDWYGFDYGSIIGSFDGVTWFAVGTKRRIRATGNKLFLAVNAPFGDLNSGSPYNVHIQDVQSNIFGTNIVANDYDNDGAQCQKQHTCNSDQDCMASLGYDYACENISEQKSLWPIFDQDAIELINGSTSKKLVSLFSNFSGGTKRCVYRGRGAPCKKNYNFSLASDSFTNSTKPRLNACNDNFYCQDFQSGANDLPLFNNKIARYNASVKRQNENSDVVETTLDEYGLGARILGRPHDYIGSEKVNDTAFTNITVNNVKGICLPGRNPEFDSIILSHSNDPDTPYLGDRVLNIGSTPLVDSADEYYSSCNILTTSGQLFNKEITNLTKDMDDTELVRLAATQAISTNALKIFETMLDIDIVKDFDSSQILERDRPFQENRCLRAPGATCFTNLDCSPSQDIRNKLINLDAEDTSQTSIINKHEINFWTESLICSQEFKSTDTDNFEMKNNRCCREIGNSLTIGTLFNQTGFAALDPELSVFDNQNAPGIGITLSDSRRYSRISTAFNDMQTAPTTFPKLETARADKCANGGCISTATLINQFNTFAKIADKTSCSGNWVRNFDSEENGGGHTWGPEKLQTFDKSNLECLNWLPGANDFTCESIAEPDDPGCLVISTSITEANKTFEYFNSLDMAGVPQISIKSADYNETLCRVDPDDQTKDARNGPTKFPLADLLNQASIKEFVDKDDNSKFRYSSTDETNFTSDKIKKVFSEDEVTCCLPPGTEVDAGSSPDLCCTGFINSETNRCQFKDFTNLSLFYNRYISSGAKDINSSLFDTETGFITSTEVVKQLACQQQACASNVIATGVGLSNLKVPGHEQKDFQIKRFIDSDNEQHKGIDSFFDAGLRWNNNVYCISAGAADLTTSNDIDVVDCSNF